MLWSGRGSRDQPTAEGTSLAQQHTPLAVRKRLRHRPSASYLQDFNNGGVDGAVTTFAVVAGVAVIYSAVLATLFHNALKITSGIT